MVLRSPLGYWDSTQRAIRKASLAWAPFRECVGSTSKKLLFPFLPNLTLLFLLFCTVLDGTLALLHCQLCIETTYSF